MTQTEIQTAPIPVTMVISEVARLDRIQEYEAWAEDLIQAVKTFEGFSDLDAIRPGDHAHPEYVIIINFDGYDHLKVWQESEIYQELMLRSRELIVGEARIQNASGTEAWFTLPDAPRANPKPAYYKMVIITTIAVYSLILLVDFVLSPLLQDVPFLLALLIKVTAVAALMNYPVMPYLTRWLRFWLFPTPSQ